MDRRLLVMPKLLQTVPPSKPVCRACRSEEKQVEIEELRAEVRRGEQRLRTAHRDMKSMQVSLTRCAILSRPVVLAQCDGAV